MPRALLTRIRGRISDFANRVALAVARTGIGPNHVTVLSLVFSTTALYAAYIGKPLLYIAFLLASGAMDVLDGAVARATGRVTRFGGFLDSTIDRVSDAAAVAGLYYLFLGFEETLVLLVVSFMISYTRARAEAAGVHMEGVGLVERAERLLFLMGSAALYAAGMVLAARLAIYLLIALSITTIAQRIRHAYISLRDA